MHAFHTWNWLELKRHVTPFYLSIATNTQTPTNKNWPRTSLIKYFFYMYCYHSVSLPFGNKALAGLVYTTPGQVKRDSEMAPSPAHLFHSCLRWRRDRPERDASCRATASAATAFCAIAIVEWGLWLGDDPAVPRPIEAPALWLAEAEGLKWAAKARISLMADLRFPSTISVVMRDTYNITNRNGNRKKCASWIQLNRRCKKLSPGGSGVQTSCWRLWHAYPFGRHEL